MRAPFRIIFLLALASVATEANELSPARTLSTSRQFIIYGPDAHLRSAVAELSERTKKIALDLLHERDDWKTPIVINASAPEANVPEAPAAELRLSQTGFGLKLQLELRIDPRADSSPVQREILRAIFLEMIYRATPDIPAGATIAQPPEWLLEGALALSEAQDFAAIFAPLKSVLASEQLPELEKFLRQNPQLLDSPSRKIYRASAAALVAMLTEMPRGKMRLARYLASLPQAGGDPLADLRSYFPALPEDAESLQKVWRAALEERAERDHRRALNLAESNQQFADLLRVELRDAKGAHAFALEEFPQFFRRPEAKLALAELSQRLLLFASRAHPLFQPVAGEYQEIIAQLARGRSKHVPERLAELRATREHIVRRMDAIGDYLNWYEATQARTNSGAFRDYLKAAEETGAERPPRRDHISVYLDALEMQLGD